MVVPESMTVSRTSLFHGMCRSPRYCADNGLGNLALSLCPGLRSLPSQATVKNDSSCEIDATRPSLVANPAVLSYDRRKIAACRVDGRVRTWKNSKHRPLLQSPRPRDRPPSQLSVHANVRHSSCNANASSPSAPQALTVAAPLPTRSPTSRKSSPNWAGPYTCSRYARR